MKTFVPKIIKWDERKWFLVDAKWKNVWRIATTIANVLRGKNKPTFTPHLDTWDYVIVINCDKINISEKKLNEKKYYRHSEYAKDWLKTETARQKLEKDPTFIIKNAVRWMIPRNRLKDDIANRLKLFVWNEHNHIAQQPQILEI